MVITTTTLNNSFLLLLHDLLLDLDTVRVEDDEAVLLDVEVFTQLDVIVGEITEDVCGSRLGQLY